MDLSVEVTVSSGDKPILGNLPEELRFEAIDILLHAEEIAYTICFFCILLQIENRSGETHSRIEVPFYACFEIDVFIRVELDVVFSDAGKLIATLRQKCLAVARIE